MNAETFWQSIISREITFFSGVPDSTFEKVYKHMSELREITYTPAVREDAAVGIASAAYFNGAIGGVLIQNSGLGNVVNALTSFNLIYNIPLLMVVGWRGFGGPPNDAPEHWIMGEKTPALLETIGVPYRTLEPNNLERALDTLLTEIRDLSIPGALLVRGGLIS